LAENVAYTLRQNGFETWLRTAWSADKAQPLVENSDLVVAIGGDGAVLRAARVCAPYQIPLLGINAGYLGFLTEASPDEWDKVLPRIIEGDFWIEERMMLTIEIWRDGVCVATSDALNEVVVGRGAIAKSVWLETYIDEMWTTTYNADGLIIATPTGSTAYALAAGGPILPPELMNILILPVAPHMSMDRPLVLSEGVSIKVVNPTHNRDTEVTVTVDGELMESLAVDNFARVTVSNKKGRFVRLRERGYFYRSLLDRLEPRLALRRKTDDQTIIAATTGLNPDLP
jgi:NAD+ kinase